MIIIIIIFIEETFSLTCGFRKGPHGYLLKRKRKSLLLGHDSMNALAKARKFPESASVLNDVMFTCQVLLFRHQKANSCQLESLAFKTR